MLRDKLIQPQIPTLENAGRLLSGLDPFPWSQDVANCRKTVFNKVPCDNKFEAEFSNEWLDLSSGTSQVQSDTVTRMDLE